jgi:hypothetical protein
MVLNLCLVNSEILATYWYLDESWTPSEISLAAGAAPTIFPMINFLKVLSLRTQ